MADGTRLVEMVKAHVVATMRSMDECAPGSGKGAGYRRIEKEAELGLELQGHDGYFTWSVVLALVQDGRVEVVPGTETRRKFRLV